MAQLKIRYRNPAQLKLRPSNPRTHTSKQIKQIAASIQEFGFVNPVLVDGSDGIVAGHARVEAAKLLGMSDVPTLRVDHLSPTQIRAYVIADNRLAENAGWDRSLLAIELNELSVDLNFDVTVTGFETAEIDLLISEAHGQAPDELDDVPPVDRSIPAVSRPGDLWKVGEHFLFCGDALKAQSYDELLQGKKAQMVFVDPPFNVPIVGHVSGRGKSQHREFAMAAGEMSDDEFTNFLDSVFQNLVRRSIDGSIHFICMDWRHIRETVNAAAKSYAEFKNLCVWSKNNGGMGSLYRSQHELVFVYKNGEAKHINNVELGRFGRNRTNIWQYAGASSFGEGRDGNEAHPTVKPLNMVADAILDCSNRGGIILDVFAGSGTTLLASEQTGRRGYGIELDPQYVDLTLRRFEQRLGLFATHTPTGLSFEQLKSKRVRRQSHDQANEAARIEKTGTAKRARPGEGKGAAGRGPRGKSRTR